VVSVIIPTYNCGRYVGEAIDSVLNQTYKAIEIIVVDDGSTDDTKESILRHYPSVRYFYQHNGGAARARNRGLREARGELIAFLDADDLWLPTKIEKQVAYFSKHPDVGLLSTNQTYQSVTGVVRHDPGKWERLFVGDSIKDIFLYSGLATPTVMVRREVLERVGDFEENLVVAEDDNLWMRIAMEYKIALIDEPLVIVRGRIGSLVHNLEDVFRGVKAHLDLIQTKYPNIAERLGSRLITRKYARLYCTAAYGYYCCDDLAKAKQASRLSLQYMWNHHAALYLLFFHMPWSQRIYKTIRRVISQYVAR
jgi:glycosyltransferase involved in cell wall biosynthesis